MHVLPLPFGMALALVPKREADQLRGRERLRPMIRTATTPRDRILGDVQSLYLRNHV